MRYADAQAFLRDPRKRITLMGMSNVGKTRLANLLPRSSWYHYSVDYRLATAYLREPIVDLMRREMMTIPYLAHLLRQDAMRVDLNVTFQNLAGISNYLGKLGNPAKGGLPLAEIKARHERHRRAEVASMLDLGDFIARGHSVYGYPHFLCDASGSLCEVIDVDDPDDPVLRAVCDRTMLVYIRADQEHEERLIENARVHPKPLYYRPSFLDGRVAEYAIENGGLDTDAFDPDAFVRWIVPRLLEARRPRYEAIAKHGYTVTAREVAEIKDEDGFLELLGKAIDRG